MRGLFRGIASVEQKGDILDSKQLLRKRLNCKKTFRTGTCPPTNPIVLKDDFDNAIFTVINTTPGLFQNSYTHGNVAVQTACTSGTLELRFMSILKPMASWPGTA